MACEYESRSVFETFTDRATLEKALDRVGRAGFDRVGLDIRHDNQGRMNELKQAYQVEAARAALKKKGFFVAETKTATGIKLTVRA
jgi:hypothetical protein